MGDTAAVLDPADRSSVVTPISEAAETAAAVEDTAATLDVDETRSMAPTPIPEAAETAAEVAEVAKELDSIVEEAQYSFRDSSRPTTPLQETGDEVADSNTAVDTEGALAKTTIPSSSSMVEASDALEAEERGTTEAPEQLDATGDVSAAELPADRSESVADITDDVATYAPIVNAAKDETVESSSEVAPVPQAIEEESMDDDRLSENPLPAGAGVAGAALIGISHPPLTAGTLLIHNRRWWYLCCNEKR